MSDTTARKWDASKIAFAVLLAGLVAVSADAVVQLDNLYLKPYSRQAEWAELRELATGAEQASKAYVRDQQADLATLCAGWVARPNRDNLTSTGDPKVLNTVNQAQRDVDAVWMTNPAGRVTAAWTKPLAGAGAMILAPEELSRLARNLRRTDAAPAAGLCKLDGKLSVFACQDVKEEAGAANLSGTVWMARIQGDTRLAKWGASIGGKVEFANSAKEPGGVLYDEGGRPMLQLGQDRKLLVQWLLRGPAGEDLGLLCCWLYASRSQAAAAGFRITMLAIASGGLGLGLLALVVSYALITRPLKQFLLRLRRLRSGEGTIDQLKAGLRGPSLALAEELGRGMTSLDHDSRSDPMTGLGNRRQFREALETFYSQALRHDRPLSIMVMDVDHFKQVNDTLGHAQGDEVIRRVARTIANGLRGADLAARLGGDEFSVLLPDTTAAQAAEVAERIRQRMMSVKASAPGASGISVSIGVADLESGPVNCCEDLVELADKSLYAVKARGRNKVLLAQTVHGDLQFNEVAA